MPSPAQTARRGAIAGPTRTLSPTLPTAPAASIIAGFDKASVEASIFKGTASWFDSPIGVSAAGPALRLALGPGWRGMLVKVTGPHGFAWTVLSDWCQCYSGTASERIVDLNAPVFEAACGALSRGVCRVTVVE